jgi:hypothetical protein
LQKLREDADKGIVYPDIYRAKLFLDFTGRTVHCLLIRDVNGYDQRLATSFLYLAASRFQAILSARKKGNVRALLRKFAHGCSAYARRGTGNDHYFGSAQFGLIGAHATNSIL